MRTIQFREAICEAMSEEMRRDDSIYLMGEEVAEYNGAYKASKGMLDEFGEKRVIDTPISELGFAGIGVGSTMTGNRPISDFMTFNFALVGIDQMLQKYVRCLVDSFLARLFFEGQLLQQGSSLPRTPKRLKAGMLIVLDLRLLFHPMHMMPKVC